MAILDARTGASPIWDIQKASTGEIEGGFFQSLDLIDSSIWLLSLVKPKTPPVH